MPSLPAQQPGCDSAPCVILFGQTPLFHKQCINSHPRARFNPESALVHGRTFPRKRALPEHGNASDVLRVTLKFESC